MEHTRWTISRSASALHPLSPLLLSPIFLRLIPLSLSISFLEISPTHLTSLSPEALCSSAQSPPSAPALARSSRAHTKPTLSPKRPRQSHPDVRSASAISVASASSVAIAVASWSNSLSLPPSPPPSEYYWLHSTSPSSSQTAYKFEEAEACGEGLREVAVGGRHQEQRACWAKSVGRAITK